jgi:hypothetical protein
MTRQETYTADVEEKVIRVRLDHQPHGTFAVFRVDDQVPCRSEHCETSAAIDWNLDMEDESESLSTDEECEAYFQMLDHLAIDVCTLTITDYARVWFVCFCDKCGEIWYPSHDESVDLESIAIDLVEMSSREFICERGQRLFRDDWNKVAGFVQSYLGATLLHEDGEFLNDKERLLFAESANSIRLETLSAN